MSAEAKFREAEAGKRTGGSSVRLRDGTLVRIREIQPDDEPMMVRFHESLSDRSVYLRYFSHLSLEQRTSHARLARVCVSDHQQNIVLVAVLLKNPAEKAEIIGVGRLCKVPKQREAEFAIVVADRWQRHGLGGLLLAGLVSLGRQEGVARIFSVMLGENRAMRSVCERAGFRVRRETGGTGLVADLALHPA